MIVDRKPDFVAKTVEGKAIAIEDEFIKDAYYASDGAIEIKADWSTYGEVAKWMTAYQKEYLPEITKENFDTYSGGGDFSRWKDQLIYGGGNWMMTLASTGEKFDPIDHDKKFPPSTLFLEIVAKGLREKWDQRVRVLSYYTGRQGLIVITVFDAETGEPMFSAGSLELFLKYRAR